MSFPHFASLNAGYGLVAAGTPVQRHRNGEYALWQRRFWEHTIRNEKDFERHVDYVHFNPVKHRLVKAAELFGLSKTEEKLLNEVPMRGAGVPMPPTDPLIYRFYELVMVNGPAGRR